MGNEPPKITTQPHPIATTDLPHLGSLTLMQADSHLCLLKTYTYSDPYLMQDQHRKLKSRINRPNPHTLNVYQLVKKQLKQICANNYQLLAYLEKPQESLREIVERRLQNRRNYSQQELYSFMGKVVDSLIYMQDNGLKNVHLDCEAILYCNDNVKILDSTLATSKNYTQLLQHLQKGTKYTGKVYLAPQLLKELEDLNYDPYISPKADIFSLGMILMEMIALESMQGYYEYHLTHIDYDSLIHRLSRITHSLPLKTLIAEMLEFDPEQRIGLVSLKQKINRLKQTEQGMSRSRSSKMLQDILSQSRRSSSNCRQSCERSGSLSRQQSSEKKPIPKIEMRCSNGLKTQESGRTSTEPSAMTARNENMSNIQNSMPASSPNQLKNLVKNKLNRGGARNIKTLKNPTQQRKTNIQIKPILEQSSVFEQSMASKKFGASKGNKEQSKNVKSTLNKLVQQSGMKKLLKIEHLQLTSNLPHQSSKNTSRFGSHEQHSHHQSTHNYSKHSDIYIQQYKDKEQSLKPDQKNTEPSPQQPKKSPQRTLQKVMTFNKDLFLNARSVQDSIEHLSRCIQTSYSKLALSPIEYKQEDKQNYVQSGYKNITIKDVPVVISQQKMYHGESAPFNFGKLQRKLNLMQYAESITQGESIDTSLNPNNMSNVIETFKPHQEDQSPFRQKHYEEGNSAPFRKMRSKRPQLFIQLDTEYQSVQTNNGNMPLCIEPANSQTNLVNKTSFEGISNFDSISPRRRDTSNERQIQEQQQFSPGSVQSFSNKRTLPSGDEYQGQMLGNQPHGNGVLYRQGKVLYSGSFKLGKYSGYGTLHNLNFNGSPVDYRHIDLTQSTWSRFQGQFQNGSMSGFGTIFFKDEKFSGCLKYGKIDGYGCFYHKSGELVSGLWADNRHRKV